MQGLGWFDGTSFGYYLAPPDGGPQWGGLPHAQITDIEVRELPGAYELWMTCVSRGIAVLTVPYTPTSVREEAVPGALLLAQNFPNPFNPATAITYTLPSQAHVKLAVYNTLGQEVARLVDGIQDAGHKSITWDASSLPSGVYLCRLETGGVAQTRKMLLVKYKNLSTKSGQCSAVRSPVNMPGSVVHAEVDAGCSKRVVAGLYLKRFMRRVAPPPGG